MYYKTKSKTNWPVVITIAVAAFFLIIIITILVNSYLRSKNSLDDKNKQVNTAIPEVLLSLNTEEENQEKVLINVKISTTDPEGLEKIVIPGMEHILIKRENQQLYETTFAATQNATYEIQAYGKNGVFGSNRVQVKNIKVFTSIEPYIPDNFTKIEESVVNSGLVVKDSIGNEYVWVPVPGGQLTRNRSETDVKYDESEPEYFQFVNSVAKYQGFYIARYESSIATVNGKEVATSKPNVTPVHRISFAKANQLSNEAAKSYQYKGYQTSITSSSAWDTALAWIDKAYSGYSTSLEYGNYSGSVYRTGETPKDKVNNIYDLAGNLGEWTSENYKFTEEEKAQMKSSEDKSDHKVVRGGSASDKSASIRSRRGNPQSSYEHIGFRYVLYKD